MKIDPSFKRGTWLARNKWGNTHSIDGVFLAYGPAIKPNNNIGRATVFDILPTILFAFNLPIPLDVDGRVLKNIFVEESEFAQRKPRYYDYRKTKLAVRLKLSRLKQRLVKKKIR